MKTFIAFILASILVISHATAKDIPSKELSNKIMDHVLTKHKLASDATVSGKKLKIRLMFNHNKANEVIHDPVLISIAKPYGIKRLEFHDWSGFSKGYISTDIK